MRKRYYTSNKKLPIVILCFIVSTSIAKKKAKETNIICFAAKSQWVCAPEGQQHRANEKAARLLSQEKNHEDQSEVTIKQLSIPQLQTSTVIHQSSQPTSDEPVKPVNQTQVRQPEIEEQLSIKALSNPSFIYTKLWSYQLIGLSTRQSALNFIIDKHLENDANTLLIKSTRDNNDWWVVLYGLYSDKQSAVDKRINLPSGIVNPWLRPLKNLSIENF